MHNDLKDSWIYQQIVQEGREEGLQAGREEERRLELTRLRQMLTTFVALRFPSILGDAQKHVETIQDPDVLQQVTLKIYTAQSEEQTIKILREAA